MLTQVNFTTDIELKKAALTKAKKQGITLKAFLNFCLKSYCEGKVDLGLKEAPKDNELASEEKQHYEKARMDLKAGQNVMDGQEVFANLGIKEASN